jgi:hypothetical protein
MDEGIGPDNLFTVKDLMMVSIKVIGYHKIQKSNKVSKLLSCPIEEGIDPVILFLSQFLSENISFRPGKINGII